jgi:alpha-glucosidase (family GH31 glycosyl hydrolase)
MTDPAVGYLPGQGYEPYDRGTQLDLWLKAPNGSASLGVVWPGMSRSPVFGRKALDSFMQASLFSLVRGFYAEICYSCD